MKLPLILLMICMNLQSIASQFSKQDISVFVTIDHHYSNQDCATITAREKIDNPTVGDEEYSLTLSLIKNQWAPKYKKTKYFRMVDQIYPQTSEAPIPQSRLHNLLRLLNESAWRHIHMHSLFSPAKTMKQLCNYSSEWMQLCKSSANFLTAIKTYRRTSWSGKADDKALSLMFHENEDLRNREKYRQAMQALYEKTKSPDDEYKALIRSMACQATRQANAEAHMHMYFSLWRQGVFQEIQWHEKQTAKKRDMKNYKKELIAQKKEKAKKLKQQLAIRPKKIKKLFEQKELRKLRKENLMLKKIKLNEVVRKQQI